MKKALISVIMVLSLVTALYAVSSVTITYTEVGNNSGMSYLDFAWVSDSASYNVSQSEISTAVWEAIMGKYVVLAITNPADGALAPDDNYDPVVYELPATASTQGVDIFATNLVNRDTANTEQYIPPYPRAIIGPLAVTVTSAGSANGGNIRLILSRQK